MNLRDKLARLASSRAIELSGDTAGVHASLGPGAQGGSATSLEASSRDDVAMSEAPRNERAPHDARFSRLEALRERLTELVARSRARRELPRSLGRLSTFGRGDAGETTLDDDVWVDHARETASCDPTPFDRLERDSGPLYVRTIRHPPSARVGRAHLAAARNAPSEAIALLALDPTLAHADASRALYLDTETTGLAGGAGTVPFLVGLAWFERTALVVEQLLLHELGEEGPILEELAGRIEQASMLVSFNGKAFDLPLLRTRFVMNRVALPPERPHLDLLHVARRVHRSARPARSSHRLRGGRSGNGDIEAPEEHRRERLGGPWVEGVDAEGAVTRSASCRLVSLERELLGFERVEDVPSSEIPARYGHFLRTRDARFIRGVCEHNAWDVVSMAALVGVYGDALTALDSASSVTDTPSLLSALDLIGVAKTLGRAGALERARVAIDVALAVLIRENVGVAGGDVEAHGGEVEAIARRVRGAIAERAHDLATAIRDYERLAEVHDDAAARLRLAKIHEHRTREIDVALAHVLAGTTEVGEDSARRRARLERKSARASRPAEQIELLPRRGWERS